MFRGLSFSPDGKRLAAASETGELKICDLTTGQATLSLKGFGSTVRVFMQMVVVWHRQ